MEANRDIFAMRWRRVEKKRGLLDGVGRLGIKDDDGQNRENGCLRCNIFLHRQYEGISCFERVYGRGAAILCAGRICCVIGTIIVMVAVTGECCA